MDNQSERRSNFILKHEDLYRGDEMFRMMVTNTVYLTTAEKESSQKLVDLRYGVGHGI